MKLTARGTLTGNGLMSGKARIDERVHPLLKDHPKLAIQLGKHLRDREASEDLSRSMSERAKGKRKSRRTDIGNACIESMRAQRRQGIKFKEYLAGLGDEEVVVEKIDESSSYVITSNLLAETVTFSTLEKYWREAGSSRKL